MKKYYDTLVEAINNKLLLTVCFVAKEKGTITRQCIPFDYGPSRRYKDGEDRFHFYDLDSPDGNHVILLLPAQINSITLTDIHFDPKDYVTWTPNWIVNRDWGNYS